MPQSKTSLLILAAGVLLVTAAGAGPARGTEPAALTPSWIRYLGDDGFHYSYQASALDPVSENLLIVVRREPAGESPSGRPETRLLRLDPAGRKLDESALEPSIAAVDALHVAAEGQLWLAADLGPSYEPFLLVLGTSGEVEWRRRIGTPEANQTTHALVPLADGTMLVVGKRFCDAFFLRLDANGEVLSDRVLDRGQDAVMLSALPAAGGGFVMLGNVGGCETVFAGRRAVWLGLFDAQAGLLTQREYSGRYGALAAAPDGRIAVLYDRGDGAEADLWLRLLAPSLRDLWRVRVAEHKGLGRPWIVPRTDGGFLVAGCAERHLWTSRLDPRGEVLAERRETATVRALERHLVVAAGSVYLLAEGYRLLPEEDRVTPQVIEVAKLETGN